MDEHESGAQLRDVGRRAFYGRFAVVLEHGAWGALGIDALLLAFALACQLEALTFLSVGGAALYAICIVLLRTRHVAGAVALAAVTVLAYVTLASQLLGWNSGFHAYLVVIVPLIFFGMSDRQGLAALLAALFGMAYLVLRHTSPASPLPSIMDPALQVPLYYFNTGTAFSFLGYLAYRFSRIVLCAERSLATLASSRSPRGLRSRRELRKLIADAIARSDYAGTPLSFVMTDIDDLKVINDRHGYGVGDRVITYVAERLHAAVRGQDIVARWGGEEFLLVLLDTDQDGARLLAERTRVAVAAEDAHLGDASVAVTLSFGVSEYFPGDSFDSCLKRALQALSTAKGMGKHRVVTAAQVYTGAEPPKLDVQVAE